MRTYFKYILYSIFSKAGLPREVLTKWGLPREAQRSGGFTLAELMVVMGIALVLMTTLVIQQNMWNDRLTVNTQAYELALMIRQAQIYSLAVMGDVSNPGDKFNIGYGVHVNMDNTDRYVFFVDRDNGSGAGNERYDSGEEIETFVSISGFFTSTGKSIKAIFAFSTD